MLRKLVPFSSAGVTGAALCLLAASFAARAAGEWRLGDRFGDAHRPASELSADDLDLSIEIPSDWLSGGSGRSAAQRLDLLRYGATAGSLSHDSRREHDGGFEFRFDATATPSAGGTHRPDLLPRPLEGAEPVRSGGISFSIQKHF